MSCSHFAEEYSRLIKFGDKFFLPESIIIIRRGKSEGWARQSDRDAICAHLATEVENDSSRAIEICRHLKTEADKMRSFMKENEAKTMGEQLYNEFWDRLVSYYQPHINVKYVVDGLSPERLEKLLPCFEDARLYAENVLNQTERFMEAMAEKIGRKEKLPWQLVLCCVKEEIISYFQIKKLPARSVLEKRDALFGIFCDQRRYAVYAGKSAERLVKVILMIDEKNILRGMTAYSGKIRGVVRVVIDPARCERFDIGDVLVSGMTRPEFLPLMKKAAAFVTDSGGILSHAAIVARELKKPCVIGTRIATQVLEDGDIVEVDADLGIVRKIK